MHVLLRRADLAACTDEEAVLHQADLLALKGWLSPEERALVWPGPIAAFARSELGKRAQTAKKVLREYSRDIERQRKRRNEREVIFSGMSESEIANL